MRKSLVFLMLGSMVLILLVGCGPEAGYGPEDIVTITGTYLDENGDPMADEEIGIWIQEVWPPSEFWFPVPDFYELTNSRGHFKIRQKGEHFLWANGDARYIIIANINEQDAPVTSMGFFAIDQNNDLADARLWDANPIHTTGSDTITFTWDALGNVDGASPDYYSFTTTARSEYWSNLWLVDEVQSGFSLPTYVFQNSCAGWRVAAEFPRADDEGIDWSYLSATIVESGNQNIIPNAAYDVLSAGKDAYIPENDTSFTQLTDQVFMHYGAFGGTHPAWVMLDLGESQTVNAAAVYDLGTSYAGSKSFDEFEVYVSDDTTSWGDAVAASIQEDGYIKFDFDATIGQYVKFQANEGSNIQIGWIGEFAAFGPASE